MKSSQTMEAAVQNFALGNKIELPAHRLFIYLLDRP
jgi:hypothetical protein